EVLTGRPPFRADTAMDTLLQVLGEEPVPPRQLNPKVPRDLETIALKCLQKEPKSRYGSAAELADDLGHFLAGEPIQARPVGRGERLWRWCRRKPVVAGLAAALVLVAVGGLSAGTWAVYERVRGAEAKTRAAIAERDAEKEKSERLRAETLPWIERAATLRA